ncbi:hypothetical protein LCGC14_2215830 [marine sediment metagenome]|uniref:Uncharacterized protein n=1 Tax=marine sediment metagenome TaxID=412755 RepID=A0A0F9DCM3_9ZZZZ
MTEHTAGPWQLDALDAIYIHEGPTLIATVSTWDISDPDEIAANAALIAAAPTMHDDLMEIAQGLVALDAEDISTEEFLDICALATRAVDG